MTDISKLADDLIALINSKPRSPTRDEILSVLMAAVIPQTEAAIEASLAQIRRDKQAGWYNLTASERAARPCFAYSSERHHYEVDPYSTRAVYPNEIPNKCVCGAIDATDTRTIRERAAADPELQRISTDFIAAAEQDKVDQQAWDEQRERLKQAFAPTPRQRELAKACIPGYLDENGNSRYAPADDYTVVIKRDRGGVPVASVHTLDAPPKTYLVSQAALDKALSCDDGHDCNEADACHRCGTSRMKALVEDGAKGLVSYLDPDKCKAQLASWPKSYAEILAAMPETLAESEEF